MDNSKQAGVLGYVAGFFDGEGSIGSGMNSGKTRNSFFMKLSFSQNDEPFLEVVRIMIAEYTGIETGKLQCRPAKYNRLSVNDNFTLSYQGGKAHDLAVALLPYSLLKTAHLQWIIDTWEGRWVEDKQVHNRVFLQAQHDNRPGRRAAATTKRKDAQK